MNNTASIQEVFNELFTHLEKLETMSEGVLLYLKEKKRVTDKQLAPYMERAGNASNVKWRAARVRVERLLTARDEENNTEESVNVRPEIARAEQGQKANKQDEKKQSHEQGGAQAKEQSTDAQVASPELEAAVQGNTKPEPERKKKVDTKDKNQTSGSHAEAAVSEKGDKQSSKQKPSGDQQIQAKNQPEEPKHEEINHPTELSQEIAQHDHGKPVDEMKPEDKSEDQEAA